MHDIAFRSRVHAALGDPSRLAIIDHLHMTDSTVSELANLTDLAPNLLAHHLKRLEAAGLIERRVSEGDHRRRYVTLRADALPAASAFPVFPTPDRVRFLCTHNSARSQYAAAAWTGRTGLAADSAGTDPADRVNPQAVRVASELGVDLTHAVPTRHDEDQAGDLLITVCDRAGEDLESAASTTAERLHWSVPDPVVSGSEEAFRRAFADINDRIRRLADHLGVDLIESTDRHQQGGRQ